MSTQSVTKKFWTPVRIVFTVVVFSLVAILVGTSCNSNDVTPTTSNRAPNLGSPGNAPASALAALPPNVLQAELRSADGRQIRLSDYSGKVLLVNLWATWCGPCRMETPELVRLHQEYKAKGVEFVGLSTEDPNSSAQKVRDFVTQYGVDYPIGWATREVALTLMQGKATIPQSFIITRDGRLFRKIDGFHPRRTPPELRKALDDALAGG